MSMKPSNGIKIYLQKIPEMGKILPFLVLGLFISASAGAIGEENEPERLEYSPEKLLENSQISYRAEGGFTGVQAYSVVIACVNGRISILKSIHDPRHGNASPIRQTTRLSSETYLRLWDDLLKNAIFSLRDAPLPNHDILDEFTVHFEARVGKVQHRFQVYGCSRPEASRYFAVKNLLDQASQMSHLWERHKNLAKN